MGSSLIVIHAPRLDLEPRVIERYELTVTAEERMQLESIARSQSLPAALSRRAQMILRLADGETNSAVARRYRVSRPTVSLWRKRYAEHGIAGLHNELKPGRPRSTGEDEIATLINTALTRKPNGKTHWSRRSLADETGLSKSTVHRYLTLFGLQPHRSKSSKLSNDPFVSVRCVPHRSRSAIKGGCVSGTSGHGGRVHSRIRWTRRLQWARRRGGCARWRRS